MNPPIKYISIFFYLLSQNGQNIVNSVDFKFPNGQNTTVDSLKNRNKGLEIITENSTGPNDASKYNFRRVAENETHYIFKKGSKCTEVRAEGETVWKAKKGDFYPGAVSYYEPDEIAINFTHDLLVLYYRRGKWRSSEELLESEIESLKQPPIPNNSGIVLNISSKIYGNLFNFISDENLETFTPKEGYFFKILRQKRMIIWSVTNPNQYAASIYIWYKSLALICQVNRRWKAINFEPEPEYLELKNNLVTLDITQKANTKYIGYVWKWDFDNFIARDINLFNKVINGPDTIWEFKNQKYANHVIVRTTGRGIKTVRVFNTDFEFEDIEIKFRLVNVDVGRMESTDEIEYKEDSCQRVYEPKHGYYFKGVNDKGGEIWKTGQFYHHCCLVKVKEVNGIKEAHIYIEETRLIKIYVKKGEGMPWIKRTSRTD
ncbi:hypothetical protein MACJ_004094 [Theileria orientalis]|uniref:Uncharacterized protein n=1 Tax=Theileria orientalis TaxID=68886 RepID=A0A976XIR6_THEOR|nr:hypothetical protein MACJ_004094 [Theileria orientalis]